MPAEWENPTGILMAWPTEETDWAFIIEEARRQFASLIAAITSAHVQVILLCKGGEKEFDESCPADLIGNIDREYLNFASSITYNDTWTRDYGPITVETADGTKELDFGFNGWGLKFAADKDNLVARKMAYRRDPELKHYENHRSFILEGGSVESDGKGTILTTRHCLLSPNRNGGMDCGDIEENLRKHLGADRILMLDYGFLEGDDTDSHIDTLARFAPDDTIIYMGPPEDKDDIHFVELRAMKEQIQRLRTAEGNPYKLIELPFPDPIYDEEGNRLPATYANYLATGNDVFVPLYSQPEYDRRALDCIGKAFPESVIVGVECTTLLKQHGSLHCSTMQLYQSPKTLKP